MLGFLGAVCATGISWLLGLDPDARREGRDGHETGGMVKDFPIGIPEDFWGSVKIGYIPNYSHLIGIMIINHWV